jgi:hypothetical protein
VRTLYPLLLALVACKAPEGVVYTDPDRPEARAQGEPSIDPARELDDLAMRCLAPPAPEQACADRDALPDLVARLRARGREDLDAFRDLELAADRLTEQLAARCSGDDNGAALQSFALQLRDRLAALED